MHEITIAPEALTVANTYIQCNFSADEVAKVLDIPLHVVSKHLTSKVVKEYTQSVMLDLGWNNNFKLQQAMDDIIDKKLEEMQELDMTSSKDIIEILKLKNDMRTSELKLSIELAKANTPVHQTNIQNNYSDLLSRIMKEEG